MLQTQKGLPCQYKAGIEVGAAVVLGIALLFSGGCKSRNLKHPTTTELIGKWQSAGTSYKDIRTYAGIYDFYAVGKHTYDIILSNGVQKQGRGVWRITEEADALQVENDTGSVYVGTFRDENFTTITMTTTNNEWGLVLTKVEDGRATSASR
ncbi:MAG: hypothetical protein V2B20_03175 [Pseudomonadota bacterium]